MSKKPLPKRTLAFKLEKHPTAERLEALRAQGIENLEDLDLLANTTANTTANTNNILLDQVDVAIDVSKTSNINAPTDISSKEATNSNTIVSTDQITSSNTNIVVNEVIDSDIKKQFSLEIQEVDNLSSANNIATTTPIHTSRSTSNSIDTAITNSIAIPTNSSLKTQVETSFLSEENFSKLQETHSASAQVIYKLLADLINKRGKATIRIGTKQLLEQTNIKSHVTIRKAIDELIIKLSIEIVEANQGKIPPVYKIVSPEEVFYKRKEANIEIDEDTKFAFQLSQRLWPNNNKMLSNTIDINIDNTTAIPIASHIDKKSQPSKNASFLNKEVLTQLKPICDKLLIEIRESSELSVLNTYPLSHIIIGICKTKKLQPRETLSLLDCLPEILTHYKIMNALPETILSQVAYDLFSELTLSK